MRNPNGCRVVLLLIPPLLLLFPVGVVTVVLERIASSILLAHTFRNVQSGAYEITLSGPASTGSNNSTNTTVTLQFNDAPSLAILGVCALAYIVSALGVFGIWELRRVEGTARHQRAWSWVVLVSSIIMVGASAGVFGYACSVQGSSPGWHSYDDVSNADQTFTPETWACQIARLYPSQPWAGAACATAKAARVLLLPMAVSALLVLLSLSVLVRGRGGVRWLFGGKGRYAGFESVYEMQPTGPAAPGYTAQPVMYWTPQPSQQWPVQPVQQWTPQLMSQVHNPGAVADQQVVGR